MTPGGVRSTAEERPGRGSGHYLELVMGQLNLTYDELSGNHYVNAIIEVCVCVWGGGKLHKYQLPFV